MTSPASSSTPSAASSSPLLAAALFDVDGTLADTDVFHRQVFRDFLRPHGIDCDEHYYNTHISGKSNALIAKEIFPDKDTVETDAMFAEKERLFREMSEAHLQPLKGLIELMIALQAANVPIAAVTNAPRPNAEMMLRVLGLSERFNLSGRNVVLGDECSEPKPSPEPYREAMRRLNVDAHPHRCVVFEDSPSGCRAGQLAGAMVIGVRTSQTHDRLAEHGAAFTVNDFTELDATALIEKMRDFMHKPHSNQQQDEAD